MFEFSGEAGTDQPYRGHDLSGTAYIFYPADAADEDAAINGDWFVGVIRRFRWLVLQMLVATLFTSLLAVAVPLFIMVVYDRVIPSRSYDLLYFLAGGMAAALAIDLVLRAIRGKMLAYLGGRIDVLLGSAVYQQVMHLPVSMTERANIGTQLSRLRQFDTIREFFTGPLANVVLELPFGVIFITVIAVIAGPIAWTPVVLVLVFVVLGISIGPAMRRAVARASQARARRQAFLIETLSQMRSIKASATEPLWSERFRELSARTSLTQFRSGQMSNLAQTLSQVLMTVAGVATLGLGAMQVMAGDMSVGALVATMALVWRVLAPLQLAFLSMTRFEQVRSVIEQVNRLMRLELEREPGSVPTRLREFKGAITFNRVSLRHGPTAEPALVGFDLAVEPGQVVVITGTNGSGKTTVLRLVAGLYKPQSGTVRVDGLDIRQLDVAELRNAAAFVAQSSQLFHGTIAQNLRLANPLATDEDLERAAGDANLLEEILALPDGFDTRMSDQMQKQLANGFKQRLMLARAYVKDAPIYLFDEPARHLDADGDAAFMRKLERLKGKATVLIVTHRPSHMRLADRIVYLSGGQVLASGTPDEILPKLGFK